MPSLNPSRMISQSLILQKLLRVLHVPVSAMVLALLFLAASTSAPLAQAEMAYQYPYSNPYLATVSVRLLRPTLGTPKTMQIPGLPGRDQTPLFEGRATTDVAYFIQPHPAPLIYIVPGLGGTESDGSALWLAEHYYLAGFNTMVFPSPMSWKFVLAQSTTAVPGFTPEDVRDLRRMMLTARTKATSQLGMQVTRQAVAGFSLGAIHAAYLMKLERSQKVLGLERALLINPPMHIPFAIDTIDRLNAVGNQWTLAERNLLWGKVINAGSDLVRRDNTHSSYYQGLDHALNLSNEQLEYLIGNSFQQTLTDVIFVSQQINDLGLLKTPATANRRNTREGEASRIGFETYMRRGAQPFWTHRLHSNWTEDQFVAQGDIQSLQSLVKTDSAYRMIHNLDDFLNDPAEIRAFAKGMGSRATLYPTGGHVGNLWEPNVSAHLTSAMSDLLN
jgi:hypothetical protein